jgi:hypothetical protein
VLSPDWPPHAITIDGGSAPTTGHLRRAVAKELSLDLDLVTVFKYFPTTATWMEMRPGLKPQSAGTAKKSAKKLENLLMAPYSLKEGDLICAFEKPEGISDPNHEYKICRPEDLRLRQLQAREKALKASGKKEKAKREKKPHVEIALSLGALEFSDDDDEEDA